MENRVKTSFWLVKSKQNKHRECPIYLRIHAANTSVQISTGHFVLAGKWDKRRKKIIGGDLSAEAINQNLVALQTKVLKIVNRLLLEGQPFNAHIVKDKLQGDEALRTTLMQAFQEYLDHIESLIGIDYSKPTLVKYSQTKQRLGKFIQVKFKREDIQLFELDYDFLDQFIHFLKTRYSNSQTTCYKHFQRFTRVVRISMRKGYLEKYPFDNFNIKLPKKPVEFLTQAEIDKIEHAEFDMERLNIIRDIFILSCYSGLAYTEVYNLTEQHLEVADDGEVWLNLTRQKTKKSIKIPLLPKAVAIIEKYKHHPISKKRKKLIPVPSNQKVNAYLKEIQDVCGIKKKLHFHLARKSFSVTIILNNAVPIETLSLLLGHGSIKVTVDAYSSITNEKLKKDFQNLKNQF
ncbi:transposase [Marivirga tractuosa]|uniref:Integrase family protein n=1 Tax=Marivirga tractuosa (strain ATCC 23168 / DSM 4126 / NBRC 15989 / NCIMB 1408 / VKM B-1430 / H-43) TaxID=643867 RepID=E4TMW5_MARTH|nr:site-specific integrase [Marivirga tractuosa]ADR21396.1 integrase family protein [Marivirga tractuosa DSM 4126]BDD14150.1 transposase [Marivirga tractuosa]